MRKNIIIILIIIILVITVRFVLNYINGYLTGKKMGVKNPPKVYIETVKDEKIIQSYEASGRVESKYQVNIVSRISGYLQKSYFKEGSYVKKGDTLFLIEPDEYKNSYDISGADIKNIKAKLEYANKQLIRASELVKKDYIAKSKYDEILSQRDSLAAQLNAANSEHKDRQRNLSYTNIKAPVEGRIGTIEVTVGNYVNASTGNLTTIYSSNPMYVTFPLSVTDYNDLFHIDETSGKPRRVELYFSNGKKYEFDGTQDYTDNKVNPSTGTVMFRATFQNKNGELLHGEFVKVIIYSNNYTTVPVVPVTAVMSNQEGKYVLKLDKKNLPQITYIKISSQAGNKWIVKEGLKSGDRVITEGVIKVIPGQPVKIIKGNKIVNK